MEEKEMRKSKYQEHMELHKEIANAFNKLPMEERMNIRIFTGDEMLSTIWRIIETHKDDLSPRVKRNLIKYANDIAKSVKEDLRLYKILENEKQEGEEIVWKKKN